MRATPGENCVKNNFAGSATSRGIGAPTNRSNNFIVGGGGAKMAKLVYVT